VVTIKIALQRALTKLYSLETAILDAEVLLAYVLNQPRSYLHAWSDATLSETDYAKYQELIERRRQLEPIAYITGQKEFWSLNLAVTKETLIPRPETELLVEWILKIANNDTSKFKCIADLGTGSGAIALALATEYPNWEIIATDICEKALAIASKNAHNLALTNISFHQGSWCNALPKKEFDLIVSNPPYISRREWPYYQQGLAFEPEGALLAEEDGLADIYTIIKSAKSFLKNAGYLLIEHGYQQAEMVRSQLSLEGYEEISSQQDLRQHERITIAKFFK